MRRKEVSFSRSFQSLTAARRWRNAIDRQHPSTVQCGLRTAPMPTKATGLPVGVSRAEKADRRGADGYVVFSVNWRQSGSTRVKSFQAGPVGVLTAEEERRARESAIAFRACYEWCVLNKWVFRPEWFSAWRTLVCFPFVPPRPRGKAAAMKLADDAPRMGADELHAALSEIFGWSNR
jgi:hypothetical protein